MQIHYRHLLFFFLRDFYKLYYESIKLYLLKLLITISIIIHKDCMIFERRDLA